MVFFFIGLSSINSQVPDICEEIELRLFRKELQPTEITTLICEDKIYISLNEFFAFIKVKHDFLGADASLMEGFFIDPSKTYIIDDRNDLIIYNDKRFDLAPDDLISTSNNLYIRLPLLDRVFRFTSSFSYRNLSISTRSAEELPVMKEARILERRLNISRLTNTNLQGDSIIRRKRPLYDFGAFSYSINTTQQTDGNNFNRIQLATGGQVFGGDFSSQLNYNTGTPLTTNNFMNTYTYADNQQQYFKQFMLGNIRTQAISTLPGALLGFQLTNQSTQLRKTFDNYLISDFTEPFWTVELYVNNVLIDYTKADAAGLYTFTVPIIYGQTNVRLRFFGDFGEEQTEERLINIPVNFLPTGEFEYQATAGVLSGSLGEIFSRFNSNYGVNSWLTVGLGNEFLKTPTESSSFPFASASVKVRNNLTFSTQYAYRTQFQTSLNYFTSSSFNLQLIFKELSESQTVIRSTARRELRALASYPIRSKYLGGTARLRFTNRSNGEGSFTNNTQLIYSGKILGVNSNLNFNIFDNNGSSPIYRLRSFVTFNIYNNFFTTPEILYNLSSNSIEFARLRIRKKIARRGFLDFNYTRAFFSNFDQYSLGLQYDFNFVRTGATLTISDTFTSFSQNISGGIEYVDYNNEFIFSKNSAINRANLRLVPYLDKNNNGRRDFNESKVIGLSARLNKGQPAKQLENGVLLFNSLEPYLEYFVELKTNSVENVAYKVSKPSFNIILSPNKTKVIEVPVKITGEIGGYIYRMRDGVNEPFSRIKVNILDENFKTVATILSEFDGYFSYLGLENGNYTARLDNVQLQKIFYGTTTPVVEFTIDNTNGGAILDNLEFYLDKRDVEFDLYDNIIRHINY